MTSAIIKPSACAEQVVIPRPQLGQSDVMDNLAAPKTPAVEASVRTVGASILLTPAFLPDFNPI
jgi:hypothetical protein